MRNKELRIWEDDLFNFFHQREEESLMAKGYVYVQEYLLTRHPQEIIDFFALIGFLPTSIERDSKNRSMWSVHKIYAGIAEMFTKEFDLQKEQPFARYELVADYGGTTASQQIYTSEILAFKLKEIPAGYEWDVMRQEFNLPRDRNKYRSPPAYTTYESEYKQIWFERGGTE